MGIVLKNITAALPGKGEKPFDVRRCSIYIDGGVIAGIDREPDGFVCEKIIEGKSRFAIPGLINAHTHTYMTVFRNSADDLLFDEWLFGNILPKEDRIVSEDSYWGAMLACMEMMRSGTTCFLDMHMFIHTVTQAALDCGIRAVISRGLSGGTDDVAGGARRMREAREEIERWKNTEGLTFMLAPHAPYSCDEGYLREIADAAKELNVGIHTHISESKNETEQVFQKYGCTPSELMNRCGLLTPTTVAAHCVQITDTDMALLAEKGVSVASNPISNLKLANGVARVPEMMKHGINVCIGTDGAASNNALNMVREMGYMALLHKGRLGDAKAVSAYDTLLMATKNGAKALGLEWITGELREGYKADIAIINTDCLNFIPHNDPIAALAYSANGSEVETVIINGRIVMENRVFTMIDEEKIKANVERINKRLKV